MAANSLSKFSTIIEQYEARARQGNLKPASARQPIKLTPPQLTFYNAKEPMVAFVAGMGCLRGTTRVYTDQGLIPMQDITADMRVLSYDESRPDAPGKSKFTYMPTSFAFQKGVDFLTRVQTTTGEFVALPTHRVLTKYNHYEHVMNLKPGDQLAALSLPANTIRTSAAIVQVESLSIEEPYYDLQVPDTNNYVTEDGTIHHNSGKTQTGTLRILSDAIKHPECNFLVMLPTYSLARDVFLPKVVEMAEMLGCTIRIRKQESTIEVNGRNLIYLRSMDDPGKMVGITVLHVLLDELDTIPMAKALTIVEKVFGRMRGKADDGTPNQLLISTTPEGFAATHKMFVKDLKDDPKLAARRRLIQASTYSNAHNLPPDFIPNMLAMYPKQLAEAYLNAQFVNLTSGSVYTAFNRKQCHTDYTIPQPRNGQPQPMPPAQPVTPAPTTPSPSPLSATNNAPQTQSVDPSQPGFVPEHIRKMYATTATLNTNQNKLATAAQADQKIELRIGADFNVEHTSAVVSSYIPSTNMLLIADEFAEMLDTPALVRAIKAKYPPEYYYYIIYPDAAGSSRNSSSASASDHQVLRDAGFIVKTQAKNPLVKDRVMSLNAALEKGKVLINTTTCPTLTDALEQQVYKSGVPDKSSGVDHMLDGCGYLNYAHFKITQSLINTLDVKGLH